MINDLITEHAALANQLVIESGLRNYTPVGNDEVEWTADICSRTKPAIRRLTEHFTAVLTTLPKDSVEHWDFCLAHLEVGEWITDAQEAALHRCATIAYIERCNAERERNEALSRSRRGYLACKNLTARAVSGAEHLKGQFTARQGGQQ